MENKVLEFKYNRIETKEDEKKMMETLKNKKELVNEMIKQTRKKKNKEAR